MLLLLLLLSQPLWLQPYDKIAFRQLELLLVMKHLQPKVTTEVIWRELSDRLRQFIRSRVTSAADTDDILQTVFLRIHQKFEELRRVERLESWVFQITRNAVADHFRKRQDRQHNVDSLEAETNLNHVENLNNEVAGCVANLIALLPADQKRAVSMYELEGLAQKEIAQRESISLSGAKSRIQRGRKSLEAMLRECCKFQFDRHGNVLQYESTANSCCVDEGCGCAGSRAEDLPNDSIC